MGKSKITLLEELKIHLIGYFPTAQEESVKKCVHLGLLIPNTESTEYLKDCIRRFFSADGYSEEVQEEEIDLGFRKGKTAVAVNIYDLHDVLRIFVIPVSNA